MPETLNKASAGAAETPAVTPVPVAAEKPRSLWSDAWRDLRRNPVFVISAVLIVFLLVVAAFPGLFTSVDPDHADLGKHYLGVPSYSHFFQEDWFGYDVQGRSIFARVLFGARASIIVGVCVTLFVTLLGGLVGMLAGYFGGWFDSLLSRITDVFFGIPLLLGAIVVLNAFTHRTIWTVVLALGILGWTQLARVMRGSVLTVKQADYVQAAKALGAGTGRIMFRHILPNAIAPVIVVATIALGGYIAAEATLSFLGIGLPPSTVSWGNDISSGQTVIRTAPHVLFFPSAMLSLTVLAFIMLGDAVRDALDPKLR
ncbi:ABC transporter permease [Streptomyces xanthochromogenes]|uniref:Peptide ABC transporter permease n=1 Tax=Streptomyces xanthochromogenes TaxID=67384 RepID=A0ABQ3A6B6_9ACTN|nr:MULTISPECIES: ABC transporter permease [Streptomyces]MYV91127.1 ABC transporter permease subunit [Streptomyces sp. SID1034]GGY34220.1 peptide ABC transporter permease [Streptomyces xanthochromogenes]GHB19943.1 peptide ABC transporter permease [Streptomyces xanthochromogenes]